MSEQPTPESSHFTSRILFILLALVVIAGSVITYVATRDTTVKPNPVTDTPQPKPKTAVKREEVVVSPDKFRKEGQKYGVKLIMVLHGRAAHEDWGVETALGVNYVVTLRYNETVLESKPEKLIVERHILELRHRLFTSIDDVDLSKDMKRAWQFLDYVSVVEPRIGQGQKAVSKVVGKLKEKILAESGRLNMNWTPILDRIGQNPAQGVKFLQSKLEGRKVQLLWTPESGVSILSGANDLSVKDRRLLQRAALLADGELFPNKNKRFGERWKVDARHFNNFLDVGLDGSLSGAVTLRRNQDQEVSSQTCAVLQILGGELQMVRDEASRKITGSISPSGDLFYDLKDDLITRASLSGAVKASFDSKDHLLFKARFKGTPKFKVSYEAELKSN